MFTIIIPNHNKAPHISRSIGSVLNQTFQDWELIFVDDASTDNSLQVINQFEDPRIQIYHRNSPGPGGYAARNFGISKASKPWLCFLDADDEWKTDYLENLKIQIDLHPEIEFFGSAWEVSNGTRICTCHSSKQYPKNKLSVFSFSDFLKTSISNSPVIWTSTAAIKKDTFKKSRGFPESLCKTGGDVDTWLRLAFQLGKVGFWNQISGTYHIDSVNMVTRKNKTFEVPCLVNTVKSLLPNSTKEDEILLKNYSNKYLLAQIAKSIKSKNFNPDLIRYFYDEVDWKKNSILKLFKFRPIRILYRLYLEKKDPFYG
ncbi:glycosyltransferase family A protein [Algoriphagus limi]|uniref:Glycosyltransferase family 2 protein n=1 Tax=Algoriphagus limi TaxID=2975273 RepID=A0ABT2G1L7_9BACT|nr:glycosyltransferase family A protein [Algoriphagus limi]MCS5488967.1 glycosyltransferase family 2 protein [Algoriphagus limi]